MARNTREYQNAGHSLQVKLLLILKKAQIFRSEDARLDAIESGIYPQDFIVEYFDTFRCVACTLLGNDLKELQSPANYPDVPRRKRSAHWTELLAAGGSVISSDTV